MKISKAIEYLCFGVMGILTAALGFNILTWQFWAFITLMVIATGAAKEGARP